MPIWNPKAPTVAEVDAAAAAAAAAQSTADGAQSSADDAQADATTALANAAASMKIAANGSDIGNIITFRNAINGGIKVTPCTAPSRWSMLTHRPFVGSPINASTCQNGRIIYLPFAVESDLTIAGLAVEVSVGSSAATYVATFARYSVASNGLPDILQADYSAHPLDINVVASFPQISFTPFIIPAGEWYLAILTLGTTIVTNPVLRTIVGPHPSCGASAPLTINAGYRQLSQASFPPTATPELTTGQQATMVYCKSG